jgi:O-methyltransferase/methyltransferase family protein
MTTEMPPLPYPFQMSRLATSYWVPQAIYVAAELGVADALGDDARSAADIARAVGADPAALERLLRALVAIEVCTAGDDGRFALTPLGSCLRSDSRDSVRAWVLLVGGPRCWLPWGRLVECVRTGKSVPALDGRATWVEPSDDPAASDTFNQSMVQLTRHLAGAVAVSYDFGGMRTVVDVGGGYGALLPPILKSNPGLRGIVFDLPRCRDGARALAEKVRLADRTEFVGGDFFTDRLPKADAYLVKSVIHDWDDARSVAILRNVRAAMDASARVLVIEPIVPDRPGSSPFDAMLAHTDLNMLVVTGGRERTERDFRALVQAAGLRVERIVPTPAAFSIIEGRLP